MRFQKLKYVCLLDINKLKDFIFPFKASGKKMKLFFIMHLKNSSALKMNKSLIGADLYLQKHTNCICNSSIYNFKVLYTTTALLERDVSRLE